MVVMREREPPTYNYMSLKKEIRTPGQEEGGGGGEDKGEAG